MGGSEAPLLPFLTTSRVSRLCTSPRLRPVPQSCLDWDPAQSEIVQAHVNRNGARAKTRHRCEAIRLHRRDAAALVVRNRGANPDHQ
jgi:hypothetical protein